MKLFWFVLVANIIGALYGFIFYYGEQLASTPLPLLIFVPDCPLYTAFFVLTIVFVWIGKRCNLFYFITAVGLLKYGIWTMSVLLAFSNHFFVPQTALLFSVLFLAHLGAAVESLALVGKMKVKNYFIVVALAWFLLNDVVDRVAGTHPILPTSDYTPVFLLSVFLSLASVPVIYLAMESRFFFLRDVLFGRRA